ACAAARTSTEPHYRSGIQTLGAYPGFQAVTAAQTPQGWNVAAIHGGASSAPAAAGSEAAEAARQNPPALTAERPGLEFSAESSVENQSDFPTYCPYVATVSPGGASSAPAAAGSEAAEAARECPFTAERPGLEFHSEPPVDFAAASSVSNHVSFEELRWMQRQKPQETWGEAAQAASECPALAEERFELDFFAEVSVENQFDLLTNCPHYATTSPGGASSLPSSVPNVAGSEAAEAVSECPAFTAE
ncbi:unnamed protein product, partial [Polarella glacialis]